MQFIWNPRTRVLYFEQPDRPLPRHLQFHRSFVGKFHCIAKQIDQHLTQLGRIPANGQPHLLRHLHRPGQALLFTPQPEHHVQIAQQPLKVEILRVERHHARFDLGDVQHLVDQRQQVVAASADRPHGILVRLRQRPVALHNLRIAQNRVHRRADLVADIGQKPALGQIGRLRHLLGRPEIQIRL